MLDGDGNGLYDELKFFFNPKNKQDQRHFLIDICFITPYINHMTTKLSPKAALVCNLLIFSSLCAIIFALLSPIILVCYTLLGILRAVCDVVSAMAEENRKIVLMYEQATKNKEKNTLNPKHNSIGLN